MSFRCGSLILVAAVVSFLAPCLHAQNSNGIFTISVEGTDASNVQLRYLLTDASGTRSFSSTAQTIGSDIVIKAPAEGTAVKSLKAIVFAPDCQFATISADNLATTTRGTFQCTKLDTVAFSGSVDVAAFGEKKLQVQVLYQCAWASQVFEGKISLSPFVVATIPVGADGTFTADLTDFAKDPLYASVTNDATLGFALFDASTGKLLATLTPTGGAVKVAWSYPTPITFVAKP